MYVLIEETEETKAVIVNTDYIIHVVPHPAQENMWYPLLSLRSGNWVELAFLKRDTQEKALHAWLEYATQNKVEM